METNKAIPTKSKNFGTRLSEDRKRKMIEVAAARGMKPTPWIEDMIDREYAKLMKSRRPE